MLAGPNSRWKRTPADAPRRTMVHGSMRGVASAEVPSLDRAGKTLALADAGNVHQLAGLKAIHQNAVAGLGLIGGVIQAHFAQTPHGRGIRLLEMPQHRLCDALRFDKFPQAQLRGVVAILLFG